MGAGEAFVNRCKTGRKAQQAHMLCLKEVHRAPHPYFPQRREGVRKRGGVMSYKNIAGAWLSVFRKTRKKPISV